MTIRRLALSAALLGTVLTGCSERYGIMQTYHGPTLPRHEVARVGGTFRFYGVASRQVTLHAIDGVPVTEGDVEVLPGMHTVTVRYSATTLSVTESGTAPCYVTFRAEPGSSYVLDADSEGNRWYCWIEETTTKERTQGTFQPPAEWPPDLLFTQ